MEMIIALMGITISISANSLEYKAVNSVDIHNLSKTQQNIWVNGDIHSIELEGSLWVPCLPEENIEIQFSEEIEVLTCGDVMEINN